MASREQESFAQNNQPSVQERQVKIARLNDQLRRTYIGGKVVQTCGIARLTPETQLAVHRAIQEFDDFSDDNDPYSEHDMAGVEVEGHRIFWKIDYYDRDLRYGSQDPANTEITTRVLTIMLASEY